MGVRVRVDVISRDIFFAPGGGLSPQDQSKALAEFARAKIAEADAINAKSSGSAVSREVYVDGVRGAALETVKPNGEIVAEYDLASDVIEWTFAQVRAASPVLTGRYRLSHRLYADGVEVESPKEATNASEIIITSVVPYARKIERGQSPKAPDGVYQAVAALAQRRFGNIARIRFTYRSPVGGGTDLEKWATRHSAKSRRPHKQHDLDTRQPAIVITLR
jgi:hypothetical protein